MVSLRLPAEWEPQEWLWIGFPHLAKEWPGAQGQLFARAQEQIAKFANTVAESGQDVRLVVRDAANTTRARELVSSKVTLTRQRYGDIWLRDTGPIVIIDNGTSSARRFGFNGWGGKYEMAGDHTVGADLAEAADIPVVTLDWILEGGAIDSDGAGLCVTTEQCLRNPNRNSHMSRADIEANLERDLGFTDVLWLGDGLGGDHTDGHVDNLARFVGERHLAIPQASSSNDPNSEIYDDAAQRASSFGLKVARIPSPGRVEHNGALQPASYANFVITNQLIVVPQFSAPNDAAAIETIGALFPDRQAIGLPSDAILTGGGSFHCASMQMPSLHG